MTFRRVVSLTASMALSFGIVLWASARQPAQAPGKIVSVTLEYHAPADGKPNPNFSPKGTQVKLTELPASAALPSGALRPARQGMIEVGMGEATWIPVLAAAGASCPQDLCQVFFDRNRNRNFNDDGPALTAAPAQRPVTNAWWTSIDKVELAVPYGSGVTEPYLVSVWIVREDGAPAPDILRYSVVSWRQGSVNVEGVEGLVAVMDADNDARFTKADTWSAMAATEPNAAKAVLTINEARPTNRLMFLKPANKEIVLEFRSVTPDGRTLTFGVIDRNITKAADRAPDDLVRDERPRARTDTPVTWGHGTAGFNAALASARAAGKLVLIDFEATWCGPCHTMDAWIWTDAEVAARIRQRYVGVKVDADLEKALVKRFNIQGYPTMVIADASGKELKRVSDYQSSAQMLAFLALPQ